MPRAGFYNENEYRDYPFRTQLDERVIVDVLELSSSSASNSSSAAYTDLPHATVVDFGAIMGVSGGFRTGTDFVWLHRIRRSGSYVLFEFRTTAPLAKNEVLYFVFDTDTEEFTQKWAESVAVDTADPIPSESSVSSSSSSLSSASSISSSETFCTPGVDGDTALVCGGPGCQAPLWDGFLITGEFSDLLELIPEDSQVVYTQGVWVIEPARIQNLNNAFVRSINLANTDRTRVTPPEECSSVSVGEREVYVNATCLQGDIQFREGYNCNIRQETATNSLIISGVVGGGEGEPCEEIPLYDGETAPAGSPFLSGGPACGELIRTISGKGGPAIRLVAGAGIRIFESPDDPSTLFIDQDLGDFALCLQPDPAPGDPCYSSGGA